MRSPSVGATLLDGVLGSAADSTGFAAEDRIVLDADAPILAGATESDAIDRWIFSGNANLVRDVEVAGARMVEDGRHRDRDAIAARYRAAMKTLLA
jgi:formimidoylglutamate deiminase